MQSSFYHSTCVLCPKRCNTVCDNLAIHEEAYQVAQRIFNNPNEPVPKAKCKDCTERHQGCHDSCMGYIVFKEYRGLVRNAKDRERKLHRVY